MGKNILLAVEDFVTLLIQTLEFVKCFLVLGVNDSPVTIDTLNTCSRILGGRDLVLFSQVLLVHWRLELFGVFSVANRPLELIGADI